MEEVHVDEADIENIPVPFPAEGLVFFLRRACRSRVSSLSATMASDMSVDIGASYSVSALSSVHFGPSVES